jgi:hypothetical protein
MRGFKDDRLVWTAQAVNSSYEVIHLQPVLVRVCQRAVQYSQKRLITAFPTCDKLGNEGHLDLRCPRE